MIQRARKKNPDTSQTSYRLSIDRNERSPDSHKQTSSVYDKPKRLSHNRQQIKSEQPSRAVLKTSFESFSRQQFEKYDHLFDGIQNHRASKRVNKSQLSKLNLPKPHANLTIRSAQFRGRFWHHRHKSPVKPNANNLREVMEALLTLLDSNSDAINVAEFLSQLLSFGVISDSAAISRVFEYDYQVSDISQITLDFEELLSFCRGNLLSNHILSVMRKHIRPTRRPTDLEMTDLVHNWWLLVDPEFKGNTRTSAVVDLLYRHKLVRDKIELKKMLTKASCVGPIITINQFRIIFSQSMLRQALDIISERIEETCSKVSPSLKLANYRRRLLFSAMNFLNTGIPIREGLQAIKAMEKLHGDSPELSDFNFADIARGR